MTSQLLQRYHQVLSAVALSDDGIGATAIADAVQLPRSTTHRLAMTLCEVGYLRQRRSAIFELGPALDDLLIPRMFNAQRSHTTLPILLNLATELQETAFFARRHFGRIEIVDALPVPGTQQSYIFPGLGERPLDKCSSSKAILAFCETQDVQTWLDSAHEKSNMPLIPEQLEGLWQELDEVRSRGYAICDGEIDEGVFSIASPVFVAPFGAVYSIGVTGPTARMKSRPLEELANQIRAASKAAAARLVAHSVSSGPTELGK